MTQLDPQAPTPTNTHSAGQTRTNHSLPSKLHILTQQLPVLLKARLHPGLPARRRRRKMKGRQIPGSEAVSGRKSQQPLPHPPWPGIAKPLRPAEIREEQETSISPGAAGRGNWIQSEQSGAGSCSREQKACRMHRDHLVLWDLRQEQGSGHRVRAWLWPAVSRCQAG